MSLSARRLTSKLKQLLELPYRYFTLLGLAMWAILVIVVIPGCYATLSVETDDPIIIARPAPAPKEPVQEPSDLNDQ